MKVKFKYEKIFLEQKFLFIKKVVKQEKKDEKSDMKYFKKPKKLEHKKVIQ